MKQITKSINNVMKIYYLKHREYMGTVHNVEIVEKKCVRRKSEKQKGNKRRVRYENFITNFYQKMHLEIIVDVSQ